VNTTGDLNVNIPIEASSGEVGNGPPEGNGGTVNLASTNGAVSISSRVEVSSDANPNASPTPPVRRSAKAGNIAVRSGRSGASAQNRAVAIDIANSGQLLSLLAAAPSPSPRPGGQIVIRATGANSDVNVRGVVQADAGTVDVRHTAAGGQINLGGAANTQDFLSMRGDVVKVGALGDGGVLRIGAGNISADTILQLYATGSNGEVVFINNVTLGGNGAKHIAGHAVTINNDVQVNVSGPAANVYVNSTNGVPNANYSSASGGNGTTNGTFQGSGATAPQPLSSAPPIGPAPGG
jgi:hypothetical protein